MKPRVLLCTGRRKMLACKVARASVPNAAQPWGGIVRMLQQDRVGQGSAASQQPVIPPWRGAGRPGAVPIAGGKASGQGRNGGFAEDIISYK